MWFLSCILETIIKSYFAFRRPVAVSGLFAQSFMVRLDFTGSYSGLVLFLWYRFFRSENLAALAAA